MSPEDLLKELGIQNKRLGKKSDKNEIMLESPENIVYSCLGLVSRRNGSAGSRNGSCDPGAVKDTGITSDEGSCDGSVPELLCENLL